MAKTFDEMTYRQDFEAVNGRQPLDEELEHAKGLVERYTVGKDGDNGVVTYHPSKKSRFKDFMTSAFGWIMRGGSLLVMTPVFLTLLFFNLIKSTIGVFVMWFVSKTVVMISIGFFLDFIKAKSVNDAPVFVKWLGELLFGEQAFLDGTGIKLNYFPHPTLDALLIGTAIVVLALIMTAPRQNT